MTKSLNFLTLFAGLAIGSGIAYAGDEGQAIYDKTCAMCHAAGVAGAPKLGDGAAWQQRVAQGMDVLVANAINGKNAMPPKGACADCSDADIKTVVEYMIALSQ